MAADSGFGESGDRDYESVKRFAEFIRMVIERNPKAVELAEEIYIELEEEKGKRSLYDLIGGISPSPGELEEMAGAVAALLYDEVSKEDRKRIEDFLTPSSAEGVGEGVGLPVPDAQPPGLEGRDSLPVPSSEAPTLAVDGEGDEEDVVALLEGMDEKEKARIKALYSASPDEIARKLRAGRELSLAEKEALRAVEEAVETKRKEYLQRLAALLSARLQHFQQNQQGQPLPVPLNQVSGSLPMPAEDAGSDEEVEKETPFPPGVGPYPHNEVARYLAEHILRRNGELEDWSYADAVFDYLYPYYEALYGKYGDNSLYGKALNALVNALPTPSGGEAEESPQKNLPAPHKANLPEKKEQRKAEPQAQQGQEEVIPPERMGRIMDIADDYAALLHAKEKIFKPFMRQRFKDALAREAEIVESFQKLLEEIGERAKANPRMAERELHLLFTSVRERYNQYAGGFLWRLRTKKATWARLAVGIALTTASFFVGGPVLAAVAGGAVALRGLGLFTTADAVGDMAHLWHASRAGIGRRIGAQLLYRREVGVGEVLESFRSAETREAVKALAEELSAKPVKVAKEAMWVRIVKRAVGAVAAVASFIPFADKLFSHAPAGNGELTLFASPTDTTMPADATSVHVPAPTTYNPSDVFVSTIDKGDGVYHLSAEMVREAKEAYALGGFDEEAARVALQQAIINGADSGDVLYADATHVEAFSHILKMVDSEAAVKWHGLPKDVWITIDPSSTPGGDVMVVEGEMREKMEQFFSLLKEASKEGYVDRKEVLALAKKAGLQIGNFVKNPPAYLRA